MFAIAIRACLCVGLSRTCPSQPGQPDLLVRPQLVLSHYINLFKGIALSLNISLSNLVFSDPSKFWFESAAMLHSPIGPSPCSSKMLSVHPQHDGYRSLPGTPLGTDPRLLNLDLTTALDQARCGLSQGGYFDSGSRCATSPMGPRTPYANDCDTEGDYRYNSSYSSGSTYSSETSPSNIYPMVCRYVRFSYSKSRELIESL